MNKIDKYFEKHYVMYCAIVMLLVLLVSMLIGNLHYKQIEKRCLPGKMEMDHPEGKPPWISCTDGDKVWKVLR